MELALRLKLDSIEKKIDFILEAIMPECIMPVPVEEEPKSVNAMVEELSKEEQLEFWKEIGVEK